MPRMPRATPGGIVYHVLNRANAGLTMFRSRAEYAAFEQALAEAHERVPVRLLGYCVMPDHWHLVVWPRRAGELSEFMRWLTVTHTRRWHAQRDVSGSGHLYRGRYRSFPVEQGAPLATVLRYVESNPRRGKEVRRAEAWPWSSLHHRTEPQKGPSGGPANGRPKVGATMGALIDPTPTELPKGWVALVNAPLADDELQRLRTSVQRGTPFGSPKWTATMVGKLGLEHTTRPRGRPRKTPVPAGTAQPAPAAKKTKPAAPASAVKATRKAATPAPRRVRTRD